MARWVGECGVATAERRPARISLSEIVGTVVGKLCGEAVHDLGDDWHVVRRCEVGLGILTYREEQQR